MMGEFNQQTENLLTASVDQYRTLLHRAEQLLKMFNDCDYSQLDEHVISFEQKQEEASQGDKLLLSLLKSDIPLWETHPLFKERLAYIKSILGLNAILVPKISSMMAVNAAELRELSGGRTALNGYGTSKIKRGGLLGVG
jgi:hypothetical protein